MNRDPLWKRALRRVRHPLGGAPAGAQVFWRGFLGRHAHAWERARAIRPDAPRVLIATSMGGFDYGVLVESSLAVALTLRGARVEFLLCDEFLPACQLTEVAQVAPERLLSGPSQPRCRSCFGRGRATLAALGLPVRTFSAGVTRAEREEARRIAAALPAEQIREYRHEGLAVGEHAAAGALRYFARGTLAEEPHGEALLRRYFEAALLSGFAAAAALREGGYEAACFNHGLYVPQGLIGEACRRSGVRVANWNPAYRKHCFIFSHGDTYHHTMIAEPADTWEGLSWTPALESRTREYLRSRWQGTQDWIWFHEQPQENLAAIERETGVDFSRPCVGLLTNVMWDAQLHYASNAFPDMLDWVARTIGYFAGRPELQLLIRVHPAEIRGFIPSRQPLTEEIRRAFPRLPPNVFVIPPESRISTYAAMARCNAVLIYNTKTGMEVSSMGVPVVVAGEAWIRNKGFSLDARTPEEYFQILDRLPLPAGLDSAQLERALRYSFHFFFRRMIPLPYVAALGGDSLGLELSNLSDLAPGAFPGLDIICDGILSGTPFIFPAERIEP